MRSSTDKRRKPARQHTVSHLKEALENITLARVPPKPIFPPGVIAAIEDDVEGFTVSHMSNRVFDMLELSTYDSAGDYWKHGQSIPRWTYSERDFTRPDQFGSTAMAIGHILMPAFLIDFHDRTCALLEDSKTRSFFPDDIAEMRAVRRPLCMHAPHISTTTCALQTRHGCGRV